jgi:hypothetical protein
MGRLHASDSKQGVKRGFTVRTTTVTVENTSAHLVGARDEDEARGARVPSTSAGLDAVNSRVDARPRLWFTLSDDADDDSAWLSGKIEFKGRRRDVLRPLWRDDE